MHNIDSITKIIEQSKCIRRQSRELLEVYRENGFKPLKVDFLIERFYGPGNYSSRMQKSLRHNVIKMISRTRCAVRSALPRDFRDFSFFTFERASAVYVFAHAIPR